MRPSLLTLLLTIMTSFYCQPVAAETITVFFGTYTGGQSKGIYKCHFDLDSGVLSDLQVAAETVNPSFLAIHPTGHLQVG